MESTGVKVAAGVAGGIVIGVLGTLSLTKNKDCSTSDDNSNHSQAIQDQKKLTNLSSKDQEKMENLMKEQLTRNYQFFGEEKQTKIRNSFVVVVGCGGVGSHAINAIVRSGVGKIRVVDFDMVTLSSLNRHAFGLRKDVGKSKVAVLEEYLKAINPQLEIEAIQELYSSKTADIVLAGNPDMVIDCIDDIDTKVNLIYQCVERKLPVVMSGGAGAKCDPTKLQIRDLSETDCKERYYPDDPLCKAVRTKLKDFGIRKGVPVLFSNEITSRKLLDLNEDQETKPEEYRALDNMRVRIIPVLGTQPSIFGMALAAYVLCFLAEETMK